MTTNTTTAQKTALMNLDILKQCTAQAPNYRVPSSAPSKRYPDAAAKLWGGSVTPILAAMESEGRFSGAALSCPPTACTGSIALAAQASSEPWHNVDAIENLVCLTGSIRIDYGPTLERSITLEQFDMLSVPAGVRHRLVNTTTQVGTVVSVLSIPAEGSYSAVFDLDSTTAISDTALEALGIQLSNERGHDEDLETRVTRFVALVPYKKDLKSSAGIPPEATEMLSAGSVFPLIVPEGHIGRSRTAPMYGNQGLYISIAECAPGDDGPPPHAHSDTQENFLVLSGDWDIYSGLDNEFAVKAKPGDVIAMPNKVMRAFRNLGAQPAQLLVIIQGPDRMSDTVSFSSKIGEELVRRFGPEIIDSYAKIRMTFDAEARLQA